jgi:hypothetical protein
MFWSKVFPTKHDLVIAICDKELLNKKIGKKFKIKVSKNFYGERLIDEDFALELMQKATVGNLIGKRIIDLAERNGFIIKKNIIVIDGIPHAQFVKI